MKDPHNLEPNHLKPNDLEWEDYFKLLRWNYQMGRLYKLNYWDEGIQNHEHSRILKLLYEMHFPHQVVYSAQLFIDEKLSSILVCLA